MQTSHVSPPSHPSKALKVVHPFRMASVQLQTGSKRLGHILTDQACQARASSNYKLNNWCGWVGTKLFRPFEPHAPTLHPIHQTHAFTALFVRKCYFLLKQLFMQTSHFSPPSHPSKALKVAHPFRMASVQLQRLGSKRLGHILTDQACQAPASTDFVAGHSSIAALFALLRRQGEGIGQ